MLKYRNRHTVTGSTGKSKEDKDCGQKKLSIRERCRTLNRMIQVAWVLLSQKSIAKRIINKGSAEERRGSLFGCTAWKYHVLGMYCKFPAT
jgi:hypothetical protein